MFAVIYRSFILPGKEQEYQQLWHQIANYFKEHCGAIGSCLHRSDDGMWVAYSRWPDKATRDNAWPGENDPSRQLPSDIQRVILAMKDCGDPKNKLPEICLEVVDDLLLINKNNLTNEV